MRGVCDAGKGITLTDNLRLRGFEQFCRRAAIVELVDLDDTKYGANMGLVPGSLARQLTLMKKGRVGAVRGFPDSLQCQYAVYWERAGKQSYWRSWASPGEVSGLFVDLGGWF